MKPLSETKKCLVCGDVFCKKPNESKRFWATRKYCSRTCSLAITAISLQDHSRNPARLGQITPWNKGLSVRLSPKSEFKKGRRNPFRGKQMLQVAGERNGNWKPPIKTHCSHCKTDLLLKPWQTTRAKRNFCNRQCWALGTRGVGSPVFLGDRATKPFRQRVMAMDEYKAWRKAVLTRDNWRCQLCSHRNRKDKPRRNMDVDHIKRYVTIVRENKIKTIEDARNCTELWDSNNGRTLCRECHRTSDTYGNKR